MSICITIFFQMFTKDAEHLILHTKKAHLFYKNVL